MDKGDWPSKEVFICDCFSSEHQIVVNYMPGDDELDYDTVSIEVHLNPSYRFLKRFWIGIRYIFGHRSRYGEWDDFHVNVDTAEKLINILQKFKDDTAKVRKANLLNT